MPQGIRSPYLDKHRAIKFLLFVPVALLLAHCSPPQLGNVSESANNLPSGGRSSQVFFPFTWRSTPPDNNEGLAELLGPLSLETVVSSQSIRAPDAEPCSSCHYEGSALPYHPPIQRGESTLIAPDLLIEGISWAQSGGWAERLVARTDFSDSQQVQHHIIAFKRWLNDRALTEPPVDWGNPITPEISDTATGVVFADVINSRTSGRSDGLRCSACHFENGPITYRPEGVTVGDSNGDIGPNTIIDGRSWSGPNGWASRFIDTAYAKPKVVQDLMMLWLQTSEGNGDTP